MKRQQETTTAPVWHSLTAIACIAAFLFAIAAASVPQLHHAFHTDAQQPQHECAITIVETGIESGDAALGLAAPGSAPVAAKLVALHPTWVPSLFLGACVFEHAPPVFS